jgi:hypothetical protein
MYINGKVFCNSIQYYGLRPTTVQPHDIAIQHGDGHNVAMQYISDAVACEDHGRVEKGDELWTESFYNGSKYPQMVFRGHLEGVSLNSSDTSLCEDIGKPETNLGIK